MSEDDEESPCKRMRTGETPPSQPDQLVRRPGVLWAVVIATVCGAAGAYEQTLKEENDSLRWQLDSYKNELELLRREQLRNSRPEEEQALGPDVEIQLLQQSLRSMQQVGPGSLTCSF